MTVNIIKRRYTREFLALSNDIVRDRRLALDEHGMLHWLLSLPNNWEINLRHIEKYWSIGARKRKRIFRSLRRLGWVQYERITNEEGEFIGSHWIVCDEPGAVNDTGTFEDDETAELDDSDDEATPLGATKPDPAPVGQAPAGSALHANRASALATDASRVGCETHPTQNSPAQLRKQTLEENREDIKTHPPTPQGVPDDDGDPPPLFGPLLRLWPADNITSAFACEKVFARLDDRHKRGAHAGLKPYLADVRSKGQTRLCDLKTYLDERRWEKFTERGRQGAVATWPIKRGTPQAGRWRTHFEQVEPAKLKFFDFQMNGSGYYTAPSEWPPAKGEPRAPVSDLSDEDSRVVQGL